jgi:predicted ester cyclase
VGTERAKTLALRVWEEAWNQGRLEAVDESIAPSAVDRHDHNQADFRSHLKAVIGEFRTGFPDLRAEVEDIVAEGDRVAMRVSLTGTHLGPFFGVAPTDRSIQLEQFHFLQVNDSGQAVRHWANTGVEELFRQLAAPAVAPA